MTEASSLFYLDRALLNTDGGSRGNPGLSGIGFTLAVDDGRGLEIICEAGAYIGTATNNQAEYQALIWGLRNAIDLKVRVLDIYADSELVIKQLKGEYKIKNEAIKPLYTQALALLSRFESHSLNHIARENNAAADALANQAMDERGTVGAPRVPFSSGELFAVEDSEASESSKLSESLLDHQEGDVSGISSGTSQGEEPQESLAGQPPASAYTPVGIYTLTIKDHFDAAHALVGYPGECKNLHGHTWDIEVSVSGTELDEVGIVYDFKDLKNDLAEILATYDHVYLNEVTPFDTINATAENLARVIYERLASVLPAHIRLKEVAVWESPIARLSYTRA